MALSWLLRGGVDFPVFIASLGQDTFHAIVDTSIQQMEVCHEILSAAAKTVGKFTRDNLMAGRIGVTGLGATFFQGTPYLAHPTRFSGLVFV
jgi:hypothetical protein